jgi:hypothetical protein
VQRLCPVDGSRASLGREKSGFPIITSSGEESRGACPLPWKISSSLKQRQHSPSYMYSRASFIPQGQRQFRNRKSREFPLIGPRDAKLPSAPTRFERRRRGLSGQGLCLSEFNGRSGCSCRHGSLGPDGPVASANRIGLVVLIVPILPLDPNLGFLRGSGTQTEDQPKNGDKNGDTALREGKGRMGTGP